MANHLCTAVGGETMVCIVGTATTMLLDHMVGSRFVGGKKRVSWKHEAQGSFWSKHSLQLVEPEQGKQKFCGEVRA